MTAASPLAPPAFAHASEAELARILDFYQVRWEYEPHTFPIGWSMTGDVVESFAPDFYLPDMDLYVELTTLKQKLVRKKNRKLRRLRELYPDIRIKLFYARDFRMLLLKFGRFALLDELSGTIGQSTPPRPADTIAIAAVGPVPGAIVPDAIAPDEPDTHDAAPGLVEPEGGTLAFIGPRHPRSRRRGRRRRAGAALVAGDAMLTVALPDGSGA